MRHHGETQCAEMRSELEFCATAQPSPSGHLVKQRESDSIAEETESSSRKPFFPRIDWTSLDKAPHKAAEESSVVMARRSRKQTV